MEISWWLHLLITLLRFGMYALVNVSSLLKDTPVSCLVENLISQETIAWLEVSIELASYGMLAVDNALRHSVVIMMKYWMPVSIALVISWLQLLLIVLPEFTTCSLAHVSHYSKAIKMKSQRFLSTLKAIKSLQHQATRLAVYGQ